MNAEQLLYQSLAPLGRTYPAIGPPDAAYPFFTYSLVAAVPEDHISGQDTMRRCTFVVDVWAETLAATKTLANSISLTLLPLGFYLESERTDWDTDAKIWRRSLDFHIYYRET